MAAPRFPAALKSALGRLLDSLPFIKRKLPSAPEPFSSIEDSSPNADIMMTANVAPGLTGSDRARIDLRGALESVSHNTPLLVGLACGLGFLLILAVTAVIVSLPPAAPKPGAALTAEGEALVKTWLVPPGSALEPRMEMERDTMPVYTVPDAFRLGADPAALDPSKLVAANDAAAQELFRTVR